MTSVDMVNRPGHYVGANGLECIDVMEAYYGLAFHVPTALAYIVRAGRKGDRIEDLRKARWYLRRALAVAGLGEIPRPLFGGLDVATTGDVVGGFGLTGGAADAVKYLLRPAWDTCLGMREQIEVAIMCLEIEIGRE